MKGQVKRKSLNEFQKIQIWHFLENVKKSIKSEKYLIFVDLLVYLWPNFHIYENISATIGQKTFNFLTMNPVSTSIYFS